MRAVILAGGLGTRLRPYTTIVPKPLVPVGDRPILEHIVRRLHDHGFRRIDLLVGHLGELIQAYLTQVELPGDLEIAFRWENEPLGTAGALHGVPDLDGTFLVMNGDVLTTLDYSALLAHHHAQEAALTIAAHPRSVPIELGVIESFGGQVTGYREKPTIDYEASMGIYVYDERALTQLPPGASSFPDLVLRLIEAGERVALFRSKARWFDIGTLSDYERAAAEIEAAPEQFGL